jgi:hypothetical protein
VCVCVCVWRRYRYESLRETDLRQVIVELRTRMETESGKYPQRKACKTWVKWVTEAGGIVRGTKPREELVSQSMEAEKARLERVEAAKKANPNDVFAGMEVVGYLEQPVVVDGSQAANQQGSILDGDVSEFDDIWPLQLIDLRDDEQFDLLCVLSLLLHQPVVQRVVLVVSFCNRAKTH